MCINQMQGEMIISGDLNLLGLVEFVDFYSDQVQDSMESRHVFSNFLW